jgi:hypothetical protein
VGRARNPGRGRGGRHPQLLFGHRRMGPRLRRRHDPPRAPRRHRRAGPGTLRHAARVPRPPGDVPHDIHGTYRGHRGPGGRGRHRAGVSLPHAGPDRSHRGPGDLFHDPGRCGRRIAIPLRIRPGSRLPPSRAGSARPWLLFDRSGSRHHGHVCLPTRARISPCERSRSSRS